MDGLKDRTTRSVIPTRSSESAGLSPSWPDLGVQLSSLGVTARLLQTSFSSGAVDLQKDGEGNKNQNKFLYLMHTHTCLNGKTMQGALVMRQS